MATNNIGLPGENFWNRRQLGDLPKATLQQPFGDLGQRDPNQTRFSLGSLVTGKPKQGTTFQSAISTIPERDLPMYNMRFDGQKPIDLGAGYMENKTQNNAQQPNTQQLPIMNYQGNGQMRLGGLGEEGKDYIQSSNLAGMDRVQKGLADRGGLSIKAPTQSAEAQAAGTTDFWLNNNKKDAMIADQQARINAANQQAQNQNLLNIALYGGGRGDMSPSEYISAQRQQKLAMQALGMGLNAQGQQQQTMLNARQHADQLGLQKQQAQLARQIGMANAASDTYFKERAANLAEGNSARESAKPFVAGGGQEWDEKAGTVINRPQRIFNYDPNMKRYLEVPQMTLGELGNQTKQPEIRYDNQGNAWTLDKNGKPIPYKG